MTIVILNAEDNIAITIQKELSNFQAEHECFCILEVEKQFLFKTK